MLSFKFQIFVIEFTSGVFTPYITINTTKLYDFGKLLKLFKPGFLICRKVVINVTHLVYCENFILFYFLKYILLIMLLQLSSFFSPLSPLPPCTTALTLQHPPRPGPTTPTVHVHGLYI